LSRVTVDFNDPLIRGELHLPTDYGIGPDIPLK
jgi:hypothetical protein